MKQIILITSTLHGIRIIKKHISDWKFYEPGGAISLSDLGGFPPARANDRCFSLTVTECTKLCIALAKNKWN